MLFLSRILRNVNNITYFQKNRIKNEIKHNNLIYKRLGWVTNPLSSINYDIPLHNEHNNNTIDSCVDVDKKYINKIIKIKNTTKSDELNTSFYDLGVEYLDMIYNYNMKSPSKSEILNNKIKHILELRFNYNHILNDHKLYQKGFYSGNNVDNTNTFEILQQKCVNNELYDNLNKYENKQHEFINNFNLKDNNIKNSEYLDYISIRKSSGFYEKSDSFIIRISGSNSNYFLNHILSTSVSNMYLNDVEYSCILDSKGIIIDTCFITKLDDYYLIISTGNKRNEVYDYISSYVVHLRGFGMDLTINPIENLKVCTLYGPLSIDVLKDILSDQNNNIKIENINISNENNNIEQLKNLMKSFYLKFSDNKEKIICYRVSDVEDGFEFILSEDYYLEFVKLILSHKYVRPIGFKAYDIARLESGLIRPDVDLTPESTPMHTSLMWNLDVKKIRNMSVFGYRQFRHNMVDGVSKMRVGLITNKMVTPYCTILTKSSRMPIGNITSSAYSPALGMYISHCYVNSHYAKHDTPVILSVPETPDSDISKSKYKKYYRNKILKTFYIGTIVRLPFINPSYRIKNLEKINRNNNNNKQSNTQSAQMADCELIVKSEEKNKIKTKKQIWKEIIKKHKKKLNGTLEMAYRKWERKDEEYNKDNNKLKNEKENEINMERNNKENDTGDNKDKENKNKYNEYENIISLSRINLDGNNNVDIEDILSYYKKRHEITVEHRHRRYRPIINRN